MLFSKYFFYSNDPEQEPKDDPPPPSDETEPIDSDWGKKSEDEPLDIR